MKEQLNFDYIALLLATVGQIILWAKCELWLVSGLVTTCTYNSHWLTRHHPIGYHHVFSLLFFLCSMIGHVFPDPLRRPMTVSSASATDVAVWHCLCSQKLPPFPTSFPPCSWCFTRAHGSEANSKQCRFEGSMLLLSVLMFCHCCFEQLCKLALIECFSLSNINILTKMFRAGRLKGDSPHF